MSDTSKAAAQMAHASWSGDRKPKLSGDDKDSIRAEYAAGGVTMRELAERMGVSVSLVSRIVAGKR